MTEPNDNASCVDPLVQPFVNQWAACVQQASETTTQRLGGFAGSADPQAWRREWFAALSGNTDAYLRSPPFLNVLKAHLEALFQAQRTRKLKPETAASGAPAAGEPGAPADRSSRLERTLKTSLEQFAQRLDAMEHSSEKSFPGELGGWDRFLSVLKVPPARPAETQGATPHEVVYEAGSLRLLRYCNEAVRFAEPILICFALVNRPYVLDLQGDRSVVRQLLNHGFDVYLIDWGTPTAADRTMQLQDYVCRLLHGLTEVACEQAGAGQLTLLGYCMGGTLSTMFAALYPQRIRNLVLMATPIDFDNEEGMLNLWARADYFDVDQLIDAFGNCPGEFLQYCFQLMRPVQNFAEKYLTVCEKLNDDAFLDNFFALERWANDSIPVAGETFREYVKLLYQQNQLVRGELTLGALPVRLEAINCPLLLLVADQDHLVPPNSTLALEHYVSSDEVQSMSINAGHIGLAVSSKAHRQLWPAAAKWIGDHSTES